METQRLTVNGLAEKLVDLIRRGFGEAPLIIEHNGSDFDIIRLTVGSQSGVVRLISVSDSSVTGVEPGLEFPTETVPEGPADASPGA